MYIVYKTTNLTNGHYYIGVHKQKDLLFDGYYGSGIGLKRAMKKYGRQSFNRETLFFFENVEDAYTKEKELLFPVYRSEDCYNMHPGGRGIRGNICFHSDEWRRKVSIANKGKKRTKEHCEKLKKIDKSYMKTEDYRSKMSIVKTGKTTRLKGRRGFVPSSMKVVTPNGTFSSLREASDELNITLYYVTKWAKSGENGYSLITQG